MRRQRICAAKNSIGIVTLRACLRMRVHVCAPVCYIAPPGRQITRSARCWECALDSGQGYMDKVKKGLELKSESFLSPIIVDYATWRTHERHGRSQKSATIIHG